MSTLNDTRRSWVKTPDERALALAVRKIKRHVLPLFIAMFMVAYIDRINVSFVRAQLQADLGIGPAAYGLGAGMFFMTYALLEVPSNVMLQRLGARAWLTRIMATWGVVSVLMAFVHNSVEFAIVRALLGATEAGFFPGVLYYFTKWLPQEERGKAVALFLSGSALSSIVSGPLSGLLLDVRGFGLHGWQWLFLIEGAGTILLSGLAWFTLVSNPAEAGFLNANEKEALLSKLSQQAQGRDVAALGAHTAMRLFRDPQVALFCFLYFCIQLTIYAALFWLPGMIRAMDGGASNWQVGMLNSVPWAISIVAMYSFAAMAARWRFQQAWVSFALSIAAAGLLVTALIEASAVAGFACICFAAIGFKAASSLFWPIPQRYLDPRIAAAALALINSVGNLGGFVAPATFGFLEQRTGSIDDGLYALSAIAVMAAMAVFFARVSPRGRRRQNN